MATPRPPINLLDPITHLPPPRRNASPSPSPSPTKQTIIIISIVTAFTVSLFCLLLFLAIKKYLALRRARTRTLWTQPERGVFPIGPVHPAHPVHPMLSPIPEVRTRANSDVEMGLPAVIRPAEQQSPGRDQAKKKRRDLQIEVPSPRVFLTVDEYVPIHRRGEFDGGVENAKLTGTLTPGSDTASVAEVMVRDSLQTISTRASVGQARAVDVAAAGAVVEVVEVKGSIERSICPRKDYGVAQQ
ncbi:uncharacterized protein EI97DRAFT_446101 [Westerdykella ornata]|uniref:Uncharacterized protein n=1 Tax=Westerdykella ornata TaxID=318751 RepID=A0A6A6J5Z8_WESOR|nr:uncharacterized protein EI97DRAFT_446101 [Westerdykella ornata]KAF2272010.1 hypothetical protein EI97DRAFT_446101 [Westerdykella ornata]